MEQWNDFPGLGVDPRDVRPFVPVARKTGQAEIVPLCPAQVMLGDDVIDLEGKIETILGQLAVFATAAGPPPHEVYQPTFHA